MNYAVVDNTGAVYAHDIHSEKTAELALGSYNIPAELEPEVIEY